MRLLLFMLLILGSFKAAAEWVAVAKTDVTATYIDPATISRNGALRRVWQIADLTQSEADGTKSRRTLYEYDCKERRFRFLSISTHSGPMASGRVLWSDNTTREWNSTAPDTRFEGILNIVCAL